MAEQHPHTEALFMNLVLTFQMAAWQQLGKIKNPITDKIEKSLEQARFSIDMLEMIREKTAGNLTDVEKRMIDHTISELQLNYVDEVEKEKKKPAEKPKTEGSPEKKEPSESKTEASPGHASANGQVKAS